MGEYEYFLFWYFFFISKNKNTEAFIYYSTFIAYIHSHNDIAVLRSCNYGFLKTISIFGPSIVSKDLSNITSFPVIEKMTVNKYIQKLILKGKVLKYGIERF